MLLNIVSNYVVIQKCFLVQRSSVQVLQTQCSASFRRFQHIQLKQVGHWQTLDDPDDQLTVSRLVESGELEQWNI